MLIGISYAYIAYSTRQVGINVLETDCINVTMEELTNAINLKNTHPITDEVGETLKPFRFKLTNTCGVGVDYNINLEVMETNNRIASSNIATKVDELEKSILSNNATAPITYQESDYTGVEAYTINSGSIEPYDNVTHEIRIWLDESAGNDAQNGTFYSKVVIDARQNQTFAYKFVDYILNDTSKSLEIFDHPETHQTPALTDYRYVGKNPNNYVCFGSEEVLCPEENLYRIIGVIPTQSEVGGEYENRVKLIKANYYTEQQSGTLIGTMGYDWNSSKKNNWEEATLNHNILNKIYWESLGEYQKYISPSVWYLGAVKDEFRETYSPNQFYNIERGNLQSSCNGALNYVEDIGLIYPSDYGFSSGKLSVNYSIYSNTDFYKTNSWLYDIGNFWVITPIADLLSSSEYKYIEGVYSMYSGKYFGATLVWPSAMKNAIIIVLPTFYLKSSVLYESGNGTIEEPYRISINE